MEWMDKLKEDLERMEAEGLQALAGVPGEITIRQAQARTSRSSLTGAGAVVKPATPSVSEKFQSPKPVANPSNSTTASTAEPPTKIAEASSGPKLSGSRKDWSEWYQVKIGVAPAGYSVEKTEFWLSGDRTCGVWAECKELTRDETQVT
jgi:hypothetical protein